MKEEIRKAKINERLNLREEERAACNKIIMDRLSKASEVSNAKTIMFYVPIKNEVDTTEIIKKLIGEGKKIVVPVTLKKENRIMASEIKSIDELERGSFGTIEPKKEFIREVSPKDIELVIVPGVAFDGDGNRIGYGYGYYDRFLRLVKAPTIALAYDFQIVDKINFYPHDFKVNKIITVNRIIECNKTKN